VLVTAGVLEAAIPGDVRFEEVGPVELKGFSAPVTLHRASRA
jgi:class 3 adenylate cyclase